MRYAGQISIIHGGPTLKPTELKESTSIVLLEDTALQHMFRCFIKTMPLNDQSCFGNKVVVYVL